MVEALLSVVERHEAPDFQIFVSSGEVANQHTNRIMGRDVTVFMGSGIVLMALLLYLLFRRASSVVLPLFAVLASLLATFGIMVLAGIPTSVSAQILPGLLLAVGVCSAVHILTIVYQRIDAGEDKATAIPFALGQSGLAVLMATLTTAGGLFSFISAELAQVANLGRVGPIGVVLTFVYCFTLLPACLAIAPLRNRAGQKDHALRLALGRGLAAVGGRAARHPWWVVGAVGAIVLIGTTGIAQVRMSQYPIRWLPGDDPVRRAFEVIDRELGGSGTLEFVIDSGRENGLHDPGLLNRIDAAARFAESFRHRGLVVGKATSIVDVAKETHKALNENQHSFYAIAQDRELLAQELLLFELGGAEDLERLTDSRFQLARLSLRMPFPDGMLMPGFIDGLEGGMREILGAGVEIESTGVGALVGRTFSVLILTLARSYVQALLIITLLMILLIGQVRCGLVSMIPNLVPIWLTLAIMGWFHVPLDNSSLLVGCVLMGLAVDDTIHFMHRFQRYYAKTGDSLEAVRCTLETAGAAMLFTTLVLASGFSVMLLTYMRNTVEFGLLATTAALLAFVADVIVSPALMVLVARHSGTASAARVAAGLRRHAVPGRNPA
jgi:predicted RND superfamily exporter protein